MREGWIENKLIELCEIYQSKTIAKSLMTDAADYIVYGANGPIGRYSEFNHEEEQVVVTCRGATCGTVNMTPKFTWITGNAMVVKPINENLTKNFLYYLLSNSSKVISVISGSAQPQITRESLGPLKFHIPPLPEQKRVVDLISSIDSLIESFEKQLESGKSARNGILHELLSTPGSDWIETTLGKVATIVNGGTPSTKNKKYWGGKYVWITTTELTAFNGRAVANSSRTLTDAGINQGPARLVPKGTTLVGTTATIGTCAYTSEEIAFNQQISGLIPNQEVLNEKFLFFLVQKSKKILENLAAGTSFKRIASTVLKQIDLILPPLPEQKRIVEIISEFDSFIQNVEKSIEDSKKLRSGLLSELLSGEHEIPASYDKVMSVAS